MNWEIYIEDYFERNMPIAWAGRVGSFGDFVVQCSDIVNIEDNPAMQQFKILTKQWSEKKVGKIF